MKELVRVKKEVIGDMEINAVNARELHQFLNSKQEYANWIKGRIDKYDFAEGVDFIMSDKIIKQVSGGKHLIEYIISLDMAKELSMVERNQKGKEARRYFIEVQKKAEIILSTLEHIDFTGNINDLVFAENGQGFTTSRVIAQKFEKEHRNVLQAIDELISKGCDSDKLLEFNALNFRSVDYLDKKQELRRAYNLTEAGFRVVALGFTGKKALEFKVDFITAFQQMRQALVNRYKVETLCTVLPNAKGKRGYVYIIGNDENAFIKIGVSKDVGKRLSQLQTGTWSELTLLYFSMICSNAFDIESIVHKIAQDKQVHGGWYDIPFQEAVKLIEEQNHSLDSQFIEDYYTVEGSNIAFSVN